MKLILKEYISSLKERDELDAILPNLLSKMGLNIIGTPTRGSREFGVDISAVGSINGEPEKLYLFSVKKGDLTRKTWDGDSKQALRPSLNEILDSYIPTRVPPEHKDKPIEICICFGGEIKTEVRQTISGFTTGNTTDKISFSEWNGDKIAELILHYFFSEDLAPEDHRRLLRKSLAMIEEPEVAFKFYQQLVDNLCTKNTLKSKLAINVLQQLNLYTSILYGWARELNNIESAYLASEYIVLKSWDILKGYINKRKTKNRAILLGLGQKILNLHTIIAQDYIEKVIKPSTNIYLGLSTTISSHCPVDINIILFDILGRLALQGIWHFNGYHILQLSHNQQLAEESLNNYYEISNIIVDIINNNPMLLTPYKDDQTIDIMLAAYCLLCSPHYLNHIQEWLTSMTNLVYMNFHNNANYPINENDYEKLIAHPIDNSNDYKKSVTEGSTLVPYLSLIAAICKLPDLYELIQKLKNEFLQHSNHQIYFFDQDSESNLYGNQELHGATLSDVNLEEGPEKLLEELKEDSKEFNEFEKLSAVTIGLYPLVLIACRHYRIPFPVHLLLP